MQANSAAHPEKLYASTPGRSWTQNLEKQMQQSPKSSKPTQQTPNPRPARKRDKATHHLPLSLLSRQRDISAIKAERNPGVYGRYLQEEDAYISNIHKAILEIVGKHWNDNKYLHRKLLWWCALAPSNSRFALNNIICRTFPAPATSGTIFLWSAFHKIP